MNLAPCVRCLRHVDVGALTCPFCAAPAALVAPRPRSLVAGRLGRAAVFAGAALVGCYTSNPPPHYGPPPPPPPPDDTRQQDPPPPPPDDQRFARPPAGTGTIRGSVRQASGLPAVGHRVLLLGRDGAEHTATTDNRGAYVFARLPAGDYTIVFWQSANPRELPNERPVALADGADLRIDGTLAAPRPHDPGPCCKPYGAPPARRRVV